jgi:beta-lactamase regulating signal transducer with metallopeptidase domain
VTIPTFLSELVRTVVIMTISGGLLCLLLLAIKPIIRHRLPKSAQYYFWLVALAALIIPISRFVVLPDTAPNATPIHSVVERNIISLNEEVIRVLAPQSTSPMNDHVWLTPQAAYQATMPPPRLPLAPLVTVFMFVYPWAVLFVLLYSLAGYIRFVKKLRRGYIHPQNFELDMLGELSNGKRTPILFKSTHAATPMLIGIFKPTIVLPDREYSEEQLRGILLHELSHMRRFDVGVKWLSLLACAVHWFNPLVWLARREIDRSCELACDEAVIHNMDVSKKQNYGDTLIAVASSTKIPLPVLSTTMCTEKRELKERLSAIMKSKKHTKMAVLASVVILLAAVLAACALGAAGGGMASGRNSDAENDNPIFTSIQADGGMTFYLENMDDDSTGVYRMPSITLFADGTATLAQAVISSFMLPQSPYLLYSFENEDLLIRAAEYPKMVEMYGLENNQIIARFTVVDINTLVFVEASVPLFADVGARYIHTPVPDVFDLYMETLAEGLSVGIFDYGDRDNPIQIRPANIIDTRINRLELVEIFDHIMPHTIIELWYFDFMVRTDDLESETLRWGTFSPDEDGWVGHHTGWNDARTHLVFFRERGFIGSIPWWMLETPYGLEGALRTFLEQAGMIPTADGEPDIMLIEPVSFHGIESAIHWQSSTMLVITYTNNTSHPLIYGNSFVLEKLINSEWEAVNSDMGFHDVAFNLEPGASTERIVDLG